MGENESVERLMALFNQETGFYNIDKYIDESYLDLTSNEPTDLVKYPIQFLNDTLGGMMKSELIVIGADSGCGKTEIANSIAYYNANQGKNVFLFSLEGDRYEVINRQRYKEYIKMMKTGGVARRLLSYREFIQNIPEDVAGEISTLDEMFKKQYKTLRVYNREHTLDMALFKSHLSMIKDTADLVIIDHLHYFDFKSKDEYGELNEIMKQIKRLQDDYRIPIVLISHLRKKDKTRIFPDQNDFHGSSNIVKQADTVICIAHLDPDGESDNAEYEKQIKDDIYKTGIRIVKARTGFSPRVVGVLDFDLNQREYEKYYELAICGNHYITYMAKDNYPYWAINRKTEFNTPKKEGK